MREHVSQADGRQTLSRRTGSGKVWTVFWTAYRQLLQSGPPEYWPLESAQPSGATKMANSVRKVRLQIEEDLGGKVTGSTLGASKDSLLWNLH